MNSDKGSGELPPLPSQVFPEPISTDDVSFETIFDGTSLEGWDGDPTYWQAKGGAIVGETTELNLPTYNSFIIWRGGRPRDFEWKLEYRVSPMGNSGLQYRSAELPQKKWVLRGCQSDIDGEQWGQMFYEHFAKSNGVEVRRVTGQNYEERGRTFLALPGQVSYVGPGHTPRMIASLGKSEELARSIREDWNRAHLIVRGNLMMHILNDRVMSIVIDDDLAHRQIEGNMGMQVHVGPPMKVEFRNIRIKML
jgi:hypothetical protein